MLSGLHRNRIVTLLLVLFIANILDVVTTVYALELPNTTELNPMFAYSLIPFKIALPIILAVFWAVTWIVASKEKALGVKTFLVVGLIALVGFQVAVVINNVVVISLVVNS